MSYKFDPDLSVTQNWRRMVLSSTDDKESAAYLAMMTPFIEMLEEAIGDLNRAQSTIEIYEDAMDVITDAYGLEDICYLLEDNGVNIVVLGINE